ncbi:hypothetical protein [Streptomyces sp. NPDC004682]
MDRDLQRLQTPRDATRHLINALRTLQVTVDDAERQWSVLDADGHVQTDPSFTELLQHAADAQDLSREILRLTADFAQSPHGTNAASSTLVTLAIATTASSQAAGWFAEAAECALSLSRATDATSRRYLSDCMLTHHGAARSSLRLTSRCARDAAKELDKHLGVRRSPTTRTLGESPVPPPPRPNGPHR